MASDMEVLREVWGGKLPVCFTLNEDEVYNLQTPEPYYLMVSRVTYFPLVCDKVRKHFSRHINPEKQKSEMWLDFNTVPIRWHYPIGVLFDLYSAEIQLPWALTVHFDKFPENEILHCTVREVVEAHFISTLKEADALKHRGHIIGSMQKKELTQLWHSLEKDNFDLFWAVNKKLMEPVANESEFKSVPFRCYRGDETPFVQRLLKPTTEGGQPKTLLNLLSEVYPKDYEKLKVVTHGVELPLDVPLQWLSEHMSYPDNFLHLCVIDR